MRSYELTFIAFALIISPCWSQSNFDWLLGTWQRTNGNEESQTIESWHKIARHHYTGTSVVIRNNDTIYQEKVNLVKENGNFFYIAEVPTNSHPIRFKITNFTKNSFTSQNINHDFPNEIRYLRNSNEIIANVSGSGKSIEYIFQKTNYEN